MFYQGQNVVIDSSFSLFNGKIYWAANSIQLSSSPSFSVQPGSVSEDSKTDKVQRVKAGIC